MSSINGRRSYKVRVWRQARAAMDGRLVDYAVDAIEPDMSFLEMIDQLNEKLLKQGEESIAIESDCREGICGTCGVVIDGRAHGPLVNVTTCTLRMREFPDGATITVEPFRANAFPVVKDLVVDRSALDRIQERGGYVSVNAGSAPEANSLPVPKDLAEEAMDSAACIQCGACVAACPNASASLFVSARIRHFALLPQGEAERARRAVAMVDQMDAEGFGDCSNHGECEAACPKAISIENIAKMRREYMRAVI
ncbi:MAG TPA: succinate dehydrogenase/fumarate reductase iron-sulfur subunit [Candidatus Binatia bacterium]|nr:succinate dehydrogenase/fumarate reductase iron-sulfur subunit [Candidatus Binatia bacterium]